MLGRRLEEESINLFIRDIFSDFGNIVSISVSKYVSNGNAQEGATRFALVEFAKKSIVKSILSCSESTFTPILIEIGRKWGVLQSLGVSNLREIAERNSIYDTDIQELKSKVDKYMAEFDENETKNELERKKRQLEVDDDGFVLAKTTKRRKLSNSNSRSSGTQRGRKPKKKYELKNFYRFQMKEEKREKLNELRKKFEEDKAKVAAMKLQRKFKPF